MHRAIVWQDRRTAKYCDSIRAAQGDTIRAKTGLVLDAYFFRHQGEMDFKTMCPAPVRAPKKGNCVSAR